jgi:hypothetical protein
MATPTNPQYPYYDTQNIFNVDIDDLYNRFITPIENQRSHYNALVPGSQELNTPQYQESRCHAFFRMIGFPVAAKSGSFYSPGYDPTLNTDATTSNSYQQIAVDAYTDPQFSASTNARETFTQVLYNPVWGAGGVNAIAVSIGSMFLRSFDKQFSDDDSIGPLDYDITQIQTISARESEIQRFFGASTATYPAPLPNITLSLLNSSHIIKPFAVDPRIDSGTRPIANRIAAPFLMDKSQLKIFDPQVGQAILVKRPYIENVISSRFSASGIITAASQPFVNSIVNQIKADGTTTDQNLISIVSNTTNLNNISLVAFSNYLNIIRALVKVLVDATNNLGQIRQNINWQPIPNVNLGPEAGSQGASITAATPGDPNNNSAAYKLELQLIQIEQQQILAQVRNVGINGVSDSGDFAFSGIDDIVFGGGIGQNAANSYDDQLQTLNDRRDKSGNDGLDYLKTIEVIVGEFSGLGLLDIMAIQAALWIVDPTTLVSLIDTRAYGRLKLQKNINAPANGTDIITALTAFETVVKQMYKLIGSYIDVITVQGQYTDIQNQ